MRRKWIGDSVSNLVVTGIFMFWMYIFNPVFEIKHYQDTYLGLGMLLYNQIDTLSYLVTLNIVIHIDVRLIYLVMINTGTLIYLVNNKYRHINFS